MILAAGTCLGPYEVLAPLGAGGMGEVYRARDTRLDRIVALKVLPADVAVDPGRHERFRREAYAISRLSHPHICTLHDVGEQDGVDFLVMEYLDGETLAHRLLRGALPLDKVLRIGVELAGALDAAHRAGVIHRDLKPANVMLTPGGAKILDFGLAKWTDSPPAPQSGRLAATDPSLTQSGVVVGTVQYMAPEQAEGKRADARSDLFALGAMLYEMTTGRRAFEGTSPSSILAAILTSSPPPMAEHQPSTSPAFERLVHRCLAKHPDARWRCAGDLEYELKWIAESGNPMTEQSSVPAHSTREALAWVAAVAACAVALLVYFSPDRSADDRAPATSVRFDIRAPAGSSGVNVPIVSPDGQKVVYVARTGDASSFLWVRSMNSLESRKLVEADDQAFPFWSPDSRSIAFFARGTLRRIDSEGGPVQVVCEAPAGRGGSWNRDGIIIFAPAPSTVLHRVPAGGGAAAPLTVLRSKERSHRFPHFFPDGRHFSYVSIGTSQIMVGSLDSDEVTSVAEGTNGEAWPSPGYLLFVRRTSLMVQPFDQVRLRPTGEAMPLGIRVRNGNAAGNMGFSAAFDGGVLTYVNRSRGEAQLTLVLSTGQAIAGVGPIGEYVVFAISPDNTHVVAEVRTLQTEFPEIWTIDLSNGTASPLTSREGAFAPVWSPDGTRIAYMAPQGELQLAFLTSATGMGNEEPLPKLTSASGMLELNDWSTDGQLLLFERSDNATGVHDLWVMPVVGDREPRPFLRTNFDKLDARFSPDGRWVAYSSDESGRFEVYLQSFPEAATKLQISRSGGTHPRWRRDGRQLYYIGPDEMVMAASISSGASSNGGAPKPLFKTSGAGRGSDTWFDVNADGSRFLFTAPHAAEPSSITVVFNWMAALKK